MAQEWLIKNDMIGDQSKQPHNEGFIRRYRDQSQLKNASEIKSDITAEATKLNKLLELPASTESPE